MIHNSQIGIFNGVIRETPNANGGGKQLFSALCNLHSSEKISKANFQKFIFVVALTALEIWCLAMIGIVFLTLFAYAAILVQVKFLPLSLSDTFSPYFTFICFHLLSFTFTLFDQVAEIVQVNFLPLPFSFTFTLIYFNFVYIIPLSITFFHFSPIHLLLASPNLPRRCYPCSGPLLLFSRFLSL